MIDGKIIQHLIEEHIHMPEIIICNYDKEDESALPTIVYRTVFFGEDLTGRNFITYQRLFFLMFAA